MNKLPIRVSSVSPLNLFPRPLLNFPRLYFCGQDNLKLGIELRETIPLPIPLKPYLTECYITVLTEIREGLNAWWVIQRVKNSVCFKAYEEAHFVILRHPTRERWQNKVPQYFTKVIVLVLLS